jgi:hypothetical protein
VRWGTSGIDARLGYTGVAQAGIRGFRSTHARSASRRRDSSTCSAPRGRATTLVPTLWRRCVYLQGEPSHWAGPNCDRTLGAHNPPGWGAPPGWGPNCDRVHGAPGPWGVMGPIGTDGCGTNGLQTQPRVARSDRSHGVWSMVAPKVNRPNVSRHTVYVLGYVMVGFK